MKLKIIILLINAFWFINQAAFAQVKGNQLSLGSHKIAFDKIPERYTYEKK